MFVGATIARYRVLEKLGAGGMGEVYRAHDDDLDRDVAVKLLLPEGDSDAASVERFIREARAASALNHPHIVTIFEAGQVDGTHFIVMELVRGRTFRALIGQPAGINILRDLGSQVAKALAAAHAAGIVHRDIKPENIMVRDDGYVKVLDFGVARLMPRGSEDSTLHGVADTVSRAVVGTLRYMSPEQASNSVVDTATDVFSLGLVLYELATGLHPFEANTAYGVLDAILSKTPAPPGRLNPLLPEEINALILRMLDKDFWNRPDAGEVAAALATAPELVPSTLVRVASDRRTVGREAERAALRMAFEQAAAGRGLMVCIAGEPGIGKSTLAEDFLSEVSDSGVACLVARGRCSERLAGTEAYLPVLDALHNLLRGQDGSGVADLLRTTAPLWHAQMAPPDSEEISAPLPPNRSGGQDRLIRQLMAFLDSAARTQPLVLFFDDVHWVDLSTVDLINYVASQFDHVAILIVITYRPEELLQQGHPFLRIKQDLQARGRCRELTLNFLTYSDVEAYLRLEFPDHQFPDTFASLIHDKTEGNPLFMVDVLRYLRDRGVLTKQEGRWTSSQAVPDIARSLPESVRSMIQRKIDGLEEDDRRLLLTASVQGYEFDAAVVANVLRLDPADVEERLERIGRSHAFVRPLQEVEFPDQTVTLKYRFVHVLYQNLLYAALTPARRIAISRAVAHALETSYGTHGADIASEIAVLFQVGREFSMAADQFLAAAKHAARIFAYREAVLLAQRGMDSLQALPESPERKRRELMLLLVMGVPLTAVKGFGHPQVEEVYSRARALCLEVNETSQFFLALWGYFNWSLVALRLDEAHEAATRLFDLGQKAENDSLIIQASHALGLVSYHFGDFSDALEHVRRVESLYDPQKHRANSTIYGFDPSAAAGSYGACALWIQGYPDRAVREIEGKLRQARELGQAYTLVYALFFASVVHQFRREWEPARQYAKELRAVAHGHDLAHFAASAQIFLGLTLAHQDRPDEGVERMREGLAAYLATGAQTSRARVTAQLAEQLGRIGRVEEGLKILEEEIDATGSARYFLAELYRVQGELLLHRNETAPAGAESCFRQAIAVAQGQRAKSLELRAVTSLCRCWQQQGRVDEARQVLAETYQWFHEGLETEDLKDARVLLSPV